MPTRRRDVEEGTVARGSYRCRLRRPAVGYRRSCLRIRSRLGGNRCTRRFSRGQARWQEAGASTASACARGNYLHRERTDRRRRVLGLRSHPVDDQPASGNRRSVGASVRYRRSNGIRPHTGLPQEQPRVSVSSTNSTTPGGRATETAVAGDVKAWVVRHPRPGDVSTITTSRSSPLREISSIRIA